MSLRYNVNNTTTRSNANLLESYYGTLLDIPNISNFSNNNLFFIIIKFYK